MQKFVEGLRGIHSFEANSGKSAYDNDVTRRVLVSEHPLVTVHPESGEIIFHRRDIALLLGQLGFQRLAFGIRQPFRAAGAVGHHLPPDNAP